MEYKEFKTAVIQALTEHFGERADISVSRIVKNNSVYIDSLVVKERENRISPTVSLRKYYEEYTEGKPMDQIIRNLISFFETRQLRGDLDLSFITDPEKVRTRIVSRIIGRKSNSVLLRQIPHREFLDLAKVYYLEIDRFEAGKAAVLIKNEHLNLWNLTTEELEELAAKNTERILPPLFCTLRTMMEELLGKEFPEEERQMGGQVPIYVLSNQEKRFGSVWIASEDVLRTISERIGDNFYILPSSVHECMIIAGGLHMDETAVQNMVKEINRTQVEPEEVLSDSLYYYSKEKGKLCIALEG